jgi:hypothetical protein
MPTDPTAGLLKPGLKLDLPGGDREAQVRRLAVLGLVRVEELSFVRCVNPLDHDQQYVKDRSCAGRIVLRADLDEDDGGFRCPDCDREVFPSRKRCARMLRVEPSEEAIRALVRRSLERLKVEVAERTPGLLSFAGRAGEVQVCLVDYCTDRAVLAPDYPRHESVCFVVGNDRDFRRLVPEGAPCFRVVDLALGEAAPVLEREVRQLARLDDARQVKPAVLALGARDLAATTRKAVEQDPYPGAVRLALPSSTPWNQVSLFLVDGETVAVRAPGMRQRRLSFRELGMADGRGGKPTRRWRLIEKVCEQHGSCDHRDLGYRAFDTFKTLVSETRPVLQHVFGIQADPFPECTKDGLRAAFHAGPDIPDEPYVGEDKWSGEDR